MKYPKNKQKYSKKPVQRAKINIKQKKKLNIIAIQFQNKKGATIV